MITSDWRQRAYPSTKAESEKRNNPASFYIYRPCSWPLTWLGLRLGVSPLQVTASAFVAAVAGLGLLAQGSAVLGALALNVAYVMDQVDGNIARYTRQTSVRGAWFDSLVGFTYGSFTLGAAGLGLFLKQGREGHADSLIAAETLMFVGLCGSASIVFRKHAVTSSPHAETRQHLRAAAGASAIPKALNSAAILLLLGAAIMGVLPFYVLAYSLYQFALALVVTTAILRRLT